MNMELRDVFSGVLNRYLVESQTRQIDKDIRTEFSDVIRSYLPFEREYLVKGSAGSGSRAQVPWFCIFDRRVTSKASEGYYLVYLFKTDMTGFYLSLNQAWTPFRSHEGIKLGRKNCRKVSEWLWDILQSKRYVTSDLHEPIDLAGLGRSGDLATGYEAGHICGLY